MVAVWVTSSGGLKSDKVKCMRGYRYGIIYVRKRRICYKIVERTINKSLDVITAIIYIIWWVFVLHDMSRRLVVGDEL